MWTSVDLDCECHLQVPRHTTCMFSLYRHPHPADQDLGRPAGSLTSAPSHDTSALASSETAQDQDAIEADMLSVPAGSFKPTQASSRNRRRAHKRAAVTAPAADDDDDEEVDEDCTVRWSAVPCVIFQPCGHLCCCELCAAPIVAAGALCPMCRASVISALSL